MARAFALSAGSSDRSARWRRARAPRRSRLRSAPYGRACLHDRARPDRLGCGARRSRRWGFARTTLRRRIVSIAMFVSSSSRARALAFRLVEGTVLSLDSAYYVAAALCVGSVEAGRLVAVALTIDASVRLALAPPRHVEPDGWFAELAYVVYFGGMSGGLARRAAAWVFGADRSSATRRDAIEVALPRGGDRDAPARHALRDPGRAAAAARPELARRTCAELAVPGIVAEASLMPIGVVLVLLYDPDQPLGFLLLSLTYLLINLVFSRLSRAAHAARGARARARDPERDGAPAVGLAAARGARRGGRARDRARRSPRPRRSRWCTGAPAASASS